MLNVHYLLTNKHKSNYDKIYMEIEVMTFLKRTEKNFLVLKISILFLWSQMQGEKYGIWNPVESNWNPTESERILWNPGESPMEF